jgi:hypothetical protein
VLHHAADAIERTHQRLAAQAQLPPHRDPHARIVYEPGQPGGQPTVSWEPTFCLGCGERRHPHTEVHLEHCELRDRVGWTTDDRAAERIRTLMGDGPMVRAFEAEIADAEGELREVRGELNHAEQRAEEDAATIERLRGDLDHARENAQRDAARLARAQADMDAMVLPGTSEHHLRSSLETARAAIDELTVERDDALAELASKILEAGEAQRDLDAARFLANRHRHRVRELEHEAEVQARGRR